MKRFIALLLTVIVCMGLVGCGNETASKKSDKNGNKYGTTMLICAESGCNEKIAANGDTKYCEKHSDKCEYCGCYIDKGKKYCTDMAPWRDEIYTFKLSGYKGLNSTVAASVLASRRLRDNGFSPNDAISLIAESEAEQNGKVDFQKYADALAQKYSYNISLSDDINAVKKSIKNGAVAIANCNKGAFTDKKGSIAIIGISEDNRFIILDADYKKSKYGKDIEIVENKFLLAKFDTVKKDTEKSSEKFWIIEKNDKIYENETKGSGNVLKILTIGNSFSDDCMQYVYDIAKSVGVDVSLGNFFIAGCTLDTHYENASGDLAKYDYRKNTIGAWNNTPETKLSTVLSSGDWDIISFQQRSTDTGMPDTYRHLDYLVNYVKSFCPNAKIVWNMTWAEQGNSTRVGFKTNYGGSQETMYNAIVNAVNEKIVPDANFSLVIPVGTAIQNARTSYLGDNLTRDGYHLDFGIGRYTAALTFVKVLTGADINGVTFRPETVDEKAAKVAIESANNAAQNPFAVTQSQYK